MKIREILDMPEFVVSPTASEIEEGLRTVARNAAVGALGMGALAAGIISSDKPVAPEKAPVATEVPVQAPKKAAQTPQKAPATDIAAMKRDFLEKTLPVIRKVNADIKAKRQKIRTILAKPNPSRAEREFLEDMMELYRVRNGDTRELLLRVDVVPPGLALAQAAIESSWGTSRLVAGGNALFGQKTRGSFAITAKDDGSGDLLGRNEISYARFIDPQASVESYIRNLNSQRAYDDFRKMRAEMRKNGGKLDAKALAGTLTAYSTERADYVNKIRRVISGNNFDRFDEAYSRENAWLRDYLRSREFDPYSVWYEVCDYLLDNHRDEISAVVGREIDDAADLHDEDPEIFFQLPSDIQKSVGEGVVDKLMQSDPAMAPSWAHMDVAGKTLHNETWLVHFSDNAEDIAFNGFRYGVDQMDRLGLTTWLGKSHKNAEGYNFAFEALSRDARGVSKKGKYGRDAVLFRNSGIKVSHFGDEEDQVIFYGRDVKPSGIVLLREDGGDWLVVPKKDIGKDYVFRGSYEEAVKWVMKNFRQYEKVIAWT